MLVRVKESLVENFYGYYGVKRRYPGDKFELVAKKDSKGKVISSVNSQFSSRWMEKVNDGRVREEPEDEVDTSMSLS